MGIQHKVQEADPVHLDESSGYSSEGNDSNWLGYRIERIEVSQETRDYNPRTLEGWQGGYQVIHARTEDVRFCTERPTERTNHSTKGN